MPAANIHTRRPLQIAAAAALTAAAGIALAGPNSGLSPASASTPSLSQLGSELNAEQAQLNANQATQEHLSSSLSGLQTQIASLTGQISIVQSREAVVQHNLQYDQIKLWRAQTGLQQERARAATLRQHLAEARHILSAQLVSRYEQPQPDLVSVVLDAHGFAQLLEQLNYLGRAESEQQSIITVTRAAKAEAQAATVRLDHLTNTDRQLTEATGLQARALQGMNQLLQSRQATLGDARAAQQAALGAAQSRGTQLRAAIANVQAQQAAAQRAAAEAAAAAAARARAAAAAQAAQAAQADQAGQSAQPGQPAQVAPSAPAVGSGGWAIPAPIVMCESGGQNLPPNSAGASGYYQILASTWQLFGGSGPAAYLASKSEQDAVASRIWNGGAGASDWVCAGLVGIS